MASPNFPHIGSETGSMEAQRARMYWIPEVHPSPSCAGSALEACGFACVQSEPGVEVCLGHSQCSLIPDPECSSCQKHRKSPLVSEAGLTLPSLPFPPLSILRSNKDKYPKYIQLHTARHTHTYAHTARHTPSIFLSHLQHTRPDTWPDIHTDTPHHT